MLQTHISSIASEIGHSSEQVRATISLLDNDATIPFISRYRKEATGSLDEVAITLIRDRITQLRELDKRREAILKSLTERELLTPELEKSVRAAQSMTALEDVYLPYKPKRRTRAQIARERGLEPLAELILQQDDRDPAVEATEYLDPDNDLPDVKTVLAGARDIVAEWISEDSAIRASLRELFQAGKIASSVIKGKETEGAKYSDYFDWEEAMANAPSHRILALRRGEAEGILRLKIRPEETVALGQIESSYVDGRSAASEQVRMACQESYKRLLSPALENEIRKSSKEQADLEAIDVFSQNLRELLMAPPVGRKRVMALDPGFRTGCKLVCLDRQGKLEYHTTVFPHTGETKRQAAAVEVKALCDKFKIRLIAIGNGTAGRETESFVRSLDLSGEPIIEMVNESGASVYSASDVAREEFPDHDVTVRGAVSIGRRIMDPLAELVKIDPKAIGVGQYQHDVDQSALRQGLDDTVSSCVNSVGVELNTASDQLLTYVSGLGPSLAKNILQYRNENGPFKSRQALKKVPRLGAKAFEQAAGFLRIADASNPLDRSAVHPESYSLVKRIATDLGCTIEQLMQDGNLRRKIKLDNYVSGAVGMPTLQDIMAELDRPGRDPRPEYVPFSYDQAVNTLEDLKAGMQLPGIVTNVTAFGAFVDVGVHQDGLVHISELADRYVQDPHEIVKVHQRVKVRIIEVDRERKRIALSMRSES